MASTLLPLKAGPPKDTPRWNNMANGRTTLDQLGQEAHSDGTTWPRGAPRWNSMAKDIAKAPSSLSETNGSGFKVS